MESRLSSLERIQVVVARIVSVLETAAALDAIRTEES